MLRFLKAMQGAPQANLKQLDTRKKADAVARARRDKPTARRYGTVISLLEIVVALIRNFPPQCAPACARASAQNGLMRTSEPDGGLLT